MASWQDGWKMGSGLVSFPIEDFTEPLYVGSAGNIVIPRAWHLEFSPSLLMPRVASRESIEPVRPVTGCP